MSATAQRIRELNDAFRSTLSGGRVLITRGVQALGEPGVAAAFARMRVFCEFTADNDPYDEHDFGSFEIGGETLFFKIDYYDAAMEGGSENPSDPAKTTRVLTLMLASEY